eukprot:scaffold3531_cov194-Alexandrium_tamarense.AAC.10
MLCSMYAACAKMKLAPEIDFTKINDAYAETNKHELSPHVVHKILFQIKFSSDNDGIGDIISFYNSLFVPSLTGLWRSIIKEADEIPTAEAPVLLDLFFVEGKKTDLPKPNPQVQVQQVTTPVTTEGLSQVPSISEAARTEVVLDSKCAAV